MAPWTRDTGSGTSRTHLPLAVRLHQLAQRGVSLDFELDHGAVLPGHLQVDVVVLRLHALLQKTQNGVSTLCLKYKTLADCWAFRQVIQSNPILKILQQSTHSSDCFIITKNLLLTSIDIYQAST